MVQGLGGLESVFHSVEESRKRYPSNTELERFSDSRQRLWKPAMRMALREAIAAVEELLATEHTLTADRRQQLSSVV